MRGRLLVADVVRAAGKAADAALGAGLGPGKAGVVGVLHGARHARDHAVPTGDMGCAVVYGLFHGAGRRVGQDADDIRRRDGDLYVFANVRGGQGVGAASADEGRARTSAVIAAVPPVGEFAGVLGLDARYIDTQRFVKSQLAGNFNAAAQLAGVLGLDDRHLRGQGGRTSVSDFGPVRGVVRIARGQQPGDGFAFSHRHAVQGPEADITAAAEARAAALDTQGRAARNDRLLGHVQAAAAHADAASRARDVDAAVDIGVTAPGSVQALARALDDRVAVQIELLVVISFNGGSLGPYLSCAADVGLAFIEIYAHIVGCDPSSGDV